jgi:hypothetical protein
MLRRLFFALLVAGALAPVGRAASTGPVFSLRAEGNPKIGYFVYDLAPGAVRSGAIVVSNVGNQTGTVKLYAADGATGATSGTVYLTERPARRAATWVSLARTTLTLKPRQHVRVGFEVRVPTGAQPGQWVAGLVAEGARRAATPRTSKRAGIRIRIRDLTIVAVQVNVPGAEKPRFAIGGAHIGGQRGFEQLLVHLANTGNVLRKPTGTVVVSRPSGAVVETLPFRMDTFLPKTTIDYPLLLKQALAPGRYVATVELSYTGANGAATVVRAAPRFAVSSGQVKKIYSSAPPTRRVATPAGGGTSGWLLIAAIGGGIVILALLGVIVVLVRRPRYRTPPE